MELHFCCHPSSLPPSLPPCPGCFLCGGVSCARGLLPGRHPAQVHHWTDPQNDRPGERESAGFDRLAMCECMRACVELFIVSLLSNSFPPSLLPSPPPLPPPSFSLPPLRLIKESPSTRGTSLSRWALTGVWYTRMEI